LTSYRLKNMGRRMTNLSDDRFHAPAFFDPAVESGD